MEYLKLEVLAGSTANIVFPHTGKPYILNENGNLSLIQKDFALALDSNLFDHIKHEGNNSDLKKEDISMNETTFLKALAIAGGKVKDVEL